MRRSTRCKQAQTVLLHRPAVQMLPRITNAVTASANRVRALPRAAPQTRRRQAAKTPSRCGEHEEVPASDSGTRTTRLAAASVTATNRHQPAHVAAPRTDRAAREVASKSMNKLDRDHHRGDQEQGDEGKPAEAEPEERRGSRDRGTNGIATRPHVLDREEDPEAEGDGHEVGEDRSRHTTADGPSARDSIPCRHRTDDTRHKNHGHLLASRAPVAVPQLYDRARGIAARCSPYWGAVRQSGPDAGCGGHL